MIYNYERVAKILLFPSPNEDIWKRRGHAQYISSQLSNSALIPREKWDVRSENMLRRRNEKNSWRLLSYYSPRLESRANTRHLKAGSSFDKKRSISPRVISRFKETLNDWIKSYNEKLGYSGSDIEYLFTIKL